MKRILFLLMAGIVSYPALSEVKLPSVLGSGMVIQQQSDVCLWGDATPDTKVSVKVSWEKKPLTTRSGHDGKWSLTVPTPAGSYDPQTITISDGKPLTLSNVLIGDVWVCAGQSNMEMPVKGNNSQAIENSLGYILAGDSEADRLRFFTVERKRSFDVELDSCGGEWKVASPGSISDFSAVGYFFGHTLAKGLNIPIGLIAADWGDTKVEAWMPRSTLKECVSAERYEEKQSNHWCRPGEMYGGMIAPIRDFKARGFIWYQGESNLKDIDHYEVMLAALVKRWREDWGDSSGSMPFYYVQVAPYIYSGSKDTGYPLFVESQKRAEKIIPNSGMATTTDLGEEYSIHPAKKHEIGQRLAALALAYTYGKDGFEPHYPDLESFRVEDGKIILKMSHAERGMNPWTLEPLTGFEIAGADKVFHPAKAWTSDKPRDEIKVWSDDVKEPVAVRYAFRNFIPANLRNTYGIPAAPFRTDNWNDVK